MSTRNRQATREPDDPDRELAYGSGPDAIIAWTYAPPYGPRVQGVPGMGSKAAAAQRGDCRLLVIVSPRRP